MVMVKVAGCTKLDILTCKQRLKPRQTDSLAEHTAVKAEVDRCLDFDNLMLEVRIDILTVSEWVTEVKREVIER